MDEVFGPDNFISLITLKKTAGQDEKLLNNVADYILWAAKDKRLLKYRDVLGVRAATATDLGQYTKVQLSADGERRTVERSDFDPNGRFVALGRPFQQIIATSSGHGGNTSFPINLNGRDYLPTAHRHWSTHAAGMDRLLKANRLVASKEGVRYVRFFDDFIAQSINNVWADVGTAVDKRYVVETGPRVVERCMLMATDPGDLVLDPTCGSGTTAYVAEQWGRRWITIDTSRVALALARTRIMSARYPYYVLADSPDGRRKEQEVSGKPQPQSAAEGDIRQGFVYERAPHVTLKSIANNAEIDVIWEQAEVRLEPLRERLNALLDQAWHDWEIPREVAAPWSEEARAVHQQWWDARIARQKEIDASIDKRADVELLYDRPYQDASRVRVAGPFTVESLSPHRIVPSDADALAGELDASEGRRRRNLAFAPPADFAAIVLENLKAAGVQQSSKADRITFTSLVPWPGEYIAARGTFMEGEVERTAAIFIGPEFGTTSRPDLTAAAREATEARFDVLIAAAFNFEAHASELMRLGPLPILKAKINPDLHMAGELKNTGKGNLFIVFGEPDVEVEALPDDQVTVRVKGVDVFDPNTGDIRSGDTKSIAAWFIDTDYDEESFFVRHAYFLGANDPYKSLKTALRAEIDEAAWATLYREVSRPFERPKSGRIAVKVINHFGDEVMKVFRV
jgi:adenine-specific DNA-methyltransferase